jgi:uncharacterized membrane protein
MAVGSGSGKKDINMSPKAEREAVNTEADIAALKRELAGYEAPGRERPDRADQVREEIARRQKQLRGRDRVETATTAAPETTTRSRPSRRGTKA